MARTRMNGPVPGQPMTHTGASRQTPGDFGAEVDKPTTVRASSPPGTPVVPSNKNGGLTPDVDPYTSFSVESGTRP